jgi:hypothetical protein
VALAAAAPVLAAFAASGDGCDRDCSFCKGDPELFVPARSVPFDFLLIEMPICIVHRASRYYLLPATYAVRAGAPSSKT